MKTCKKGLHQYEGTHCLACARERIKEWNRKARRAAGIPVRACLRSNGMKTCKKGLHQYDEGMKGCPVCRLERNKGYLRKMRRAAGIPVRECVYGESKLERNKRYMEEVGLGYAASAMGVRVKDVPVEVLEAKVALIKLNRKLKEERNG